MDDLLDSCQRIRALIPAARAAATSRGGARVGAGEHPELRTRTNASAYEDELVAFAIELPTTPPPPTAAVAADVLLPRLRTRVCSCM